MKLNGGKNFSKVCGVRNIRRLKLRFMPIIKDDIRNRRFGTLIHAYI